MVRGSTNMGQSLGLMQSKNIKNVNTIYISEQD